MEKDFNKHNDLLKNYDFKECESSFSLWNIQKELNKINICKTKKSYAILLPPPNVTGVLHLGHAWNGTIQDCLIRYYTLKGKNAYWICGKDHAGIATQTKYEKELKKQKIDYSKLSRITNIKNLTEWCKNNANQIEQQWKKMGFFLDYENQHFTLDQEVNDFVINVFVKMYEDKLIYQDFTLVNWDVKLQSAVSNIEVIKKPVNSKLYYVKYYFENSNEYLVVATTRPETIFVDECLIVNPKDKRYKNYINQFVINPFTKQKIKIISDNYVDINFGTGVMKCTPAHDFNDYKLAKKYNLKIVSCFNLDGTTNEFAFQFKNLPIKEARKQCVTYLQDNNLLLKVEDIISNVGFSERTNEVIEPMMSLQWFVKTKEFANKIIKLQSSKNKVNFVPLKFEKSLINWLKNIDDWCISRQLWWGHQIPVYYHKKNKSIIVSNKSFNNQNEYEQDLDVLDTWFSSGLWPLATNLRLQNKDKLFPTDVLVTGYDIIFFWVFRMMFFSLYLTNKMPFKVCYINGLTRDEKNQKMSKSLGNGIDPIKVCNQYGADALRLFLLSSSAPGFDLHYSETKVKQAAGFLNKLYHCFKYIITNSKQNKFKQKLDLKQLNEFDNWILNKFKNCVAKFEKLLTKYQFLLAIKNLIDFVWNDFCNTYLELSKNSLNKITLFVLNYVIKNILILLHPICPFITSYLYDLYPFKRKSNILLETINLIKINNGKTNFINNLLILINQVRNYKYNQKLSNNTEVEIYLKLLDNKQLVLNELTLNILTTAKIKVITKLNTKNLQPDFVTDIYHLFIVKNKNNINNSLSKEQILKEIDLTKNEILRCNNMLNNKNFILKANKDKIKLEQEKLVKHTNKLKELEKLIK